MSDAVRSGPKPPPVEFAPTRSHATYNGGAQHVYEFPNGYSASVVRGPYTYGGPEGFWEIAVMDKDGLNYSTPITDDVLGWQTDDDLAAVLVQIAALPDVSAGGSL